MGYGVNYNTLLSFFEVEKRKNRYFSYLKFTRGEGAQQFFGKVPKHAAFFRVESIRTELDHDWYFSVFIKEKKR